MSFPPRIGRYHVVGRLATGGMAEILLGKLLGPSGFERPVVIKRILPILADQESFVKMFVDEARVVARISHPNVVQVLELGEERGELFIAMEYLEGETVLSMMRRHAKQRRRLDRFLGIHIATQVAAGLHAAHELRDDEGRPLSLVHRDVSPANLFVTYAGGVKILDFGVAKFNEQRTQTEAGQMKGKFAYMAPEQCLGEPVDRRADVFALGTVLYEMTTGKRLFSRDTSLLSMKAITEQRIPSPSEVVSDYPEALERVVMRALERDREARYPTAAAMRAELAEVARDLGAPALMEDRLAERMRELFPERLEEKRELLQRVKAGSEITRLPEVDVDILVELPDAARPTPVGVATETPRPRPRRPSPMAILGLLALIGMMGGVGVGLLLASARDETLESAVPRAAVSAGAEDASPEAPRERPPTEPSVEPAPPPPRFVRLTVLSEPPGATVTVDGEARGRTPIDLSVERGDERLVVALERSGYAPRTIEVVPERDHELEVELVAARRARRRRRAAPEPTDESAESPFRRFN